jgi:hypothetical protein
MQVATLKSVRWAWPVSSSKMLSGFTSRWMMLLHAQKIIDIYGTFYVDCSLIYLYLFSTGISETIPPFNARGSSSASTWKLSHHLPTLSLEHLSLSAHLQQKSFFVFSSNQGDQIGRIFVYILGNCLLCPDFFKLQKRSKILDTFVHG